MINSIQFSGFPDELFQFLVELSANNNREWFNDNKSRYQESVVLPVTDFIVAIANQLEKVSPYFYADPRPNRGSMFRIYRDTRFAKDKRPYKGNVGCQFRHKAGRGAHGPGFYLHLQPGNNFVGAGIWKPSSDDLDKIRMAIVERKDVWNDILNNKTLFGRFGIIEGETLKRIPRGYDADFIFAEDLKRKSFFIKQTLDQRRLASPDIVGEISQAYMDSVPLMNFLTDSLGLPF